MLKASLQDHAQTPSVLTDRTSDTDSLSSLADGLKALADTTRLRIIYLLMARGEMCVCEFMPALGLIQSNVSFHLKTLKQARFITSRKEGKWMYYSLDRKVFEKFCAGFGDVFDLGRLPEKTEPVCCERTSCRELESR